jgi:anaerobic magnesium-protoporphyrin IX monomethyl ester cyclase
MKKMLFIVPMHITFESFLNPAHNSRTFPKADGKTYNSLSTDLPLGPLSMSAYLKKHLEIEVHLVDFNAEINALEAFPYRSFYECCFDILSKLFSSHEKKFDYVGISSLFSPSYNNFLDCGLVSKALFPGALILGGGNIPTNSYEAIYTGPAADAFDALCYGEGEKPLLNLLTAESPQEYLMKSEQWITKHKVVESSSQLILKHDFIEDLDEIPFFDYDLCDFEKHASNQVTSSFHSVDNKRGFHIMTSRGCPYLCTFCASHKTHGRKMRYHSLNRVKEDLTRLTMEYGAGTLVFQDDHLMADKDRVYQILKIVGDLGVESLYQNGLTLYALDMPMLQAFYDAGVRHLVLPVESGSERVLKELMHKPLKLRISERVAKDCRDLGIYTNTNILIGMPGETKQDLDDGRLNLRKIATNWFNIACASPIVGSDMHQLAKNKNYIKLENLGADYRFASIHTEDFTPEYIQEYQYRMNLELNFVLNNDIKCGEYRLALKAFDNVIRLRSDHAFAHYFAAICHRELGDLQKENYHTDCYLTHGKTEFWSKWVSFFGLQDTKAGFKSLPKGVPASETLYNRCERQLVEIDTQ